MSQIEISIPDTLLVQLKKTARKEGVSLEQYILFALTRQTMLSPAIHKLSEKDAESQHKDFTERINRLGKTSSEELEEILQERESVEPDPGLEQETVLRFKNRIDEAKSAL
jgi:DNA-directed RNA polymerase specialized sigma54-like protein